MHEPSLKNTFIIGTQNINLDALKLYYSLSLITTTVSSASTNSLQPTVIYYCLNITGILVHYIYFTLWLFSSE